MGRIDDVINVAGHRLSTGEMEEVLASHPAVAECAVFGVNDELKGEVPRGLVVLKAGVAASKDQLGRELAQMIRDHARWCETNGAEGKPSVFDGADLRALETVRGFNLTALSAKGATFYALDMEGVQLQGAHLEGADLRACNLRRADLRGARLMGAKLSGSDLREAVLGPLLIGNRVLPCDMTRPSRAAS